MTAPNVRGRRPSAEERAQLRKDFTARFRSGESMHQIAGDTGWSYSFVQGLLWEVGVGAVRERGAGR